MLRNDAHPAAHPWSRSAGPAWVLAAGGAAAAVLVAVGPVGVAAVLFLAVAAGSTVATIVGAGRHADPAARRSWWLIALAEAAFLGGAALRMVVPGAADVPPGPASLVPNALVVPGYAMLTFAVVGMLRLRRAADDDPAHADALSVGLASALAAWTLLIEPTLDLTGTVAWPRLVVGFFPIIDALILTVVTQLLLANGVRTPALWLLGAAAGTMFLGDLLFALRDGSVYSVSPPLSVLDALFLCSFTTIGAAALHPTVGTLTEPQRVVVRTLSTPRTASIAAVLVVPAALAIGWPTGSTTAIVVRLVLSALLTCAVVTRIARANNVRVRAEETNRHRATHDALTDLPNRELLAETVTRWCDQATDDGKEISLLFLDLDRFKMVNDNWGHQVGDELLCAVADRLSRLVRAEDLVCRIGGDEFVIALASNSPDALARSLAERLLTAFAEPFTISIGDIVITPSIGVARSQGATAALELIRDADTAMYRAKSAGRNGYAFFDSDMRVQVRVRVDLEQALRGALDRGELSVHYQPIVDLGTDELAGFEALMRWRHPQLGAVSPTDFIPIAEDTGLIVASGSWLLTEAVGQLARWRAARPPGAPDLHMSVNVSVRQLRDDRLVHTVRRALDETGVPASALWLEITESAMIEEPERSIAILRELHGLGTVLCIDDFGTGYSSLSYLRRLPAGIVKIDRSFVAAVGQNRDDEAIVRTVVAMAHALEHRVVAEGVETVTQRDWLRELGCDLVQGWLYGAPRPAAAQTAWIEADNSDLLDRSR